MDFLRDIAPIGNGSLTNDKIVDAFDQVQVSFAPRNRDLSRI